jgi:alkaline phosphatase isozyme conversion protein
MVMNRMKIRSRIEAARAWSVRVLWWGLTIVALVTTSSLGASFQMRAAPSPGAVEAGIARGHMVALSREIGPRVAGTEGERRAAAYIEARFEASGYTPLVQDFTFTGGRRGGRSTLHSANVIAVKQGYSEREIVVGAHYDSESEGRGADDNASGVGVLLAAAEVLKDVSVPYTLRFVAFGAEEAGRRGSRFYVDQMSPEAIQNTVAMINLDSLVAGDVAYVYGSRGDDGVIRDWVLRIAAEEDLDLVTQAGVNPTYPPGTTGDFSDHGPFEDVGIQYAYFESTNWALGNKDGYVQVNERFGDEGYIWHTPYDTLDYIDRTFPGRVDQRLRLFSSMLHRVLTEFGPR